MKILNAMDLKGGKKADRNRMGTLTQPVQFISNAEKDDEWTAWNMDWFEWQGLKQLSRNARRLLKNYKLANGIIDRSDYIVEEDNEYTDIVQSLTHDEGETALDLKFYPIIPNVVKTLTAEFAKRNTRITYKAVDDTSYNEMMEQRRQLLEDNLIKGAEAKLKAKLIERGIDFESEEGQQALSGENVRSLPEIEGFFRKSYTNIAEEWAQHQQEADYGRFAMDELEERAFKDLLITDREFWHFKMLEDDYDIEIWNPVLTFYHKAPETRYISDGNWVGKVDMMTIADVIDKYGWLLTEEQHASLEAIYPINSAGYTVKGQQNDGSFYDATKSHKWNTEMPSLGYRQYMSMTQGTGAGDDIVSWILGESEDFLDFGSSNLLRVTTTYWKSQVKIGHLTKIDENGSLTQDIVGEEYIVTDKPMYNTNFIKNKGRENLVFGEHIDWIWLNQVWGGVKIGPNHSSYLGMRNGTQDDPMYIGINQNNIGPIKFQFKGDKTLYGCKLPVEGRIFTDRNSRSTSLVDQMKPFQIGYNIVNNQMADILIDELGTVILLDQNALPKHSMGEDWGKNNLAKAYVAMKDFSMLPLDTTISNTEGQMGFSHFQKLDMEQTNRLMSRIQLAGFFKQQAFENIGVTPQRMGQQIGQYQSGKAVEETVAGSYAQTEEYFINHCDHLMPRVHQMRTDLAQYYNATKPSIRLQYMTAQEEKMNFQIYGTELMLRDINVFATTKANHRAIMENLRSLAINNNTSGASIYDLGDVLASESIPEMKDVMKKSEEKVQAQAQEQRDHDMKMQEQSIKAAEAEKQAARDHEAMEAEKTRRKDIMVAEIRAAGMGALVDLDENKRSDFQDEMETIRKSEEYQEQTDIKREVEGNKMSQHRDKMSIEREKMANQKAIADNQLAIARENKNRFDKPKESGKKPKKNNK